MISKIKPSIVKGTMLGFILLKNYVIKISDFQNFCKHAHEHLIKFIYKSVPSSIHSFNFF